MARYLLTAAILAAAGMFAGYGETWLSYLGYTIAGFAAPILTLVWMLRSDRYEREPLSLVAFTFGWGIFCGIFAGLINGLVVPVFGSPAAGFVEEPLKLLGVYLLATSTRLGSEFNDHLDGMVYGAAVGAGFAGMENLYYILDIVTSGGAPAWFAILIRSATGFCHIAWSSTAGRSLGLAKALRGGLRAIDMLPGLVVAIPLHALWNASPGLISLAVLLPFYIAAFLRQVKAAQEDERRWGFTTMAPVE